MTATPESKLHPVTVWNDDIDGIIMLIRDAGELLSNEDAVYHDQDLELLVPAISRVFLKYAEQGAAFHTRKMAMIQIFDCITRFVEDPDLIPEVDLQGLVTP
jgi:hypothetical protein